MNTNPIDPVFLEAVQMKHTLAIKTNDPNCRYPEAIVRPHYVREGDTVMDKTGHYVHFNEKKPLLWAYVEKQTGNTDFLIEHIVEWKILGDEDLTSRKIPQKVYRDLPNHPFGSLIVEVDKELRRAWGKAAEKYDFDPAPFIEKDRRLGEIAEELAGWFPR